MSKTISERSSFQLFLWGLLLLPFAYVADSVLDAVLFKQGDLLEQLTTPTYHESAGRILFSTFILAGIYLGMNFLAKSARRERSLGQRNMDLALAKQEREEFDGEAIQNLRDAVTELVATVDLMQTQNNDTSNEKQLILVESVKKASDRLACQLEIFSSLTEQPAGELRRERVVLDKLADEIIATLHDLWADRSIKFKVQPWMNVWCDPALLRQVLTELFCNALNFIPNGRSGQIDFGMFDRNGQSVFYVRDNGIGFNQAQAERLFNPFRDITQDIDLPRNTMPLVNARQLILRHGGKIWAEGIPGAGGTIYFTHFSR